MALRHSAPLRAWLTHPLCAALLGVLAIYFYWAQAVHVQGRGDLTSLIHVGKAFAAQSKLPHDFGVREERGNGFDGQFFLYLASDPLLSNDATVARLDDPLLRARRIGYPLAICLGALGHEYSMAAMMFLICAVSVGASAGALCWLGALAPPPRRALLIPALFIISYPTLASCHLLTAESLAMALVALAVVALRCERFGLAALFCAYAALTKETTAMLPLMLMLAAITRRDGRRALLFAATLLPLAAWVGWLHWGRGLAFVAASDLNNLTLPFVGPVSRLADVIMGRVDQRSGLAVAQILMLVAILAAPCVAAWGWWRQRTALWGALFVAGLLAASLPADPAWWFWANYARQVYMLGVLTPLVVAAERQPLRSGAGALLALQAAAGVAHLIYYFCQL